MKDQLYTLRNIAREAVIYGYSPVYCYWYLMDEVFDENSVNYIGSFNTMRHYQHINTPKDKMITPAVDFFYSRCWLDLRAEPVVVTIPRVTPQNRYYVLQSIGLDHYNLDFFGSRTGGQDGGSVLYVGPSYKGEIDESKFARIVRATTDFVYLQGRILFESEDDAKKVWDIQDQITVKTLSEFLGKGSPQPCKESDFLRFGKRDDALYTREMFDFLPFLLQFIHLDEHTELQMLDRFKKIGIEAGKRFDLSAFSDEEQQAILAGIEDGAKDVKQSVETAVTSIGVLGTEQELNYNYLRRDAGVGAGIFGNSPEEAMYFGKSMSDAKPGEKYVLHFEKGHLPAVHDQGFWSVTMYDLPQRLLVDNPIDRYSLGDRSGDLVYNDDGSLDIYMQSEAPSDDKRSNWLPTPKNGPFWYIIRQFYPEDVVSTGKWTAPEPKMQKEMADT